jgi:hypothetical protein
VEFTRDEASFPIVRSEPAEKRRKEEQGKRKGNGGTEKKGGKIKESRKRGEKGVRRT